MYRYLCVCSLIAFCASTAAQGAPRELVAAKPKLVCPKTDLANEKLQSHYDTMWATYSTEGEKASAKLEAELEKQLKAAQSAGNLNLALFWQSAMTQYQQLGQLRWDDTDQRKRWKGHFGDAPFPAEFHVFVQKTCEDYSAAKEGLRTGYVELEKAFTMEGDFQRALAMRNEFAQLDAPPKPAPVTSPSEQPTQKATPPQPATPAIAIRTSQQLAQLLRGTLWRNASDFFFEWDATGKVWHYHKDSAGARNPVQVTYTSGAACDIVLVAVNAKQKIVFDDDLKTFKQMSDDGKTVLKTAVRVR